VLREIWRGRVWSARPVIVVEDTPDRVMLYSPHGNRFRAPVTAEGAPLRIYVDDWHLAVDEWRGPNVLSFAFPGVPYAVLLFLEGYYVNLESPLVRTEVGFDYVEHILDATIPADRSGWSWKDEDELAEAVLRGLFTRDDVERFRHWGERAVEHVLLREPPFDRDWATWRPDPSWTLPALPDGWETAPIEPSAGPR
jgi:predicted RNA-binding protein associated with RNAse of E/G family